LHVTDSTAPVADSRRPMGVSEDCARASHRLRLMRGE
jgi:hypothetical protein